MQKKIATAVVALALASPQACNAQEGLAKIKTIVVIYAENRSFESKRRTHLLQKTVQSGP